MIKNFEKSTVLHNTFNFQWSTRIFMDFYEEYDFFAIIVEDGYIEFGCEQEDKLSWKLKGTDVIEVFNENKHDILDDIADTISDRYYDYSR